MKHTFAIIYSWFIRSILFFLPDIPCFMRLRGFCYSLAMPQCGANFQVAHSAVLNGLDQLYVGKDVYIANFCSFISNGNIYIGSEVLFGPSVVISAGNHTFDGESYRHRASSKMDVHIEEGSWIAANVTIVGGSTVPKKSIIAANSCVSTKMELQEHALYGGVPAIFIKELCV